MVLVLVSFGGNWTTGWHLNETFVSPAGGETNGSSNITLEEGRYVWSVYCNDTGGYYNNTVENRTLTVDLTSIILTLPLNNTADSDGLVYFNYTVTDSLIGLDSCWLTIDGLVNVTNTTTEIPENFTVSLTEGRYAWNISCNDSLNNVANSDTYDLSVDLATEFSGDTTDLSQVNVTNITNLAIEVPSDGKINFTDDIDLSNGSDLDTYVNLSFNRIEVNITGIPELNKAAILYLYNLTFTDPKVLKDDVDCVSSICTELSYTSGILAFSVTGFSVYSAAETPTTTTTPATTAPSATGGGSYSGASPSPTAFSSTTSVDLSTGDFVALSVAQGASFIAKNVEHFVDVKEIGEDFVRLWIYSEPIEVVLKVGKRASVDVNNDTLTDVSIELRGISNGYALLYFKEVKSVEEVKMPEGQKVSVEESSQKPLELPKLELLPKVGAKEVLISVIESFESWVKNLVQKIIVNKYWLTISLLVIISLFAVSFKHCLRKPSVKKEDLPVKKRKIWPYLLALTILILIIICLILRIKGYGIIIFEKLITIKDLY